MTTVQSVIAALEDIAHPSNIPGVTRFFTGNDPDTLILGVPIGKIFPIAKLHRDADLACVSALLDDRHYEVRMAAMAILDFKAQRRGLPDADRKALFDLYLARLDRINNWDLVDRAAGRVIGGYLLDKDTAPLDRLADAPNPCARRTAIVATHAFLRTGNTGETFRICDRLAQDPHAYVQKAIASWTHVAGKSDREGLVAFIERNKQNLARPTITAATRGLDADLRARLRR